MRRLIPLAALLLGCGTASTTPIQMPTQVPQRAQATTSGFDITLNSAAQPLGATFDEPVDRIWPLAVDAFTRVGLKIDRSDAPTHQIRGKIQVRRQLNGKALSNYFECGQEMTGAIADTWRLTIDAHLAVAPGPKEGTSVVATMLSVPEVRPIEGTSTSVTQCSSKGRLETMIAQTIRKLLDAR